jgi:hypothetical protein
LAYAIVIDRFGDASALYLSTGLALTTLVAAAMLKLLFGRVP